MTDDGSIPRRAGWHYATAGLFIASIAAVISYNDGLFVARLAGNHDRQAFLYPFLPDGLIVVGLLALLEAARRGIPRSRWATGAVLLGIGMTLGMNAGAGVAHSVLDAVLDGLVPVVFFVAAEVVLWHVRRGRGDVDSIPRVSPAASAGVSVPPPRGYKPPPQRAIMTSLGVGQGKARRFQRLLVSEVKAASNGHGDTP